MQPGRAAGQVEPGPAGPAVVFGAGAGLSYLSPAHLGGAVGPEVKLLAELPLNDRFAAGVQAGLTYRREEECIAGPGGTDCSREGVFRPGAALRLRVDHGGSEVALAVGLHGREPRRYAEISYAIPLSGSGSFDVGAEGLLRASPFGIETGLLIRLGP